MLDWWDVGMEVANQYYQGRVIRPKFMTKLFLPIKLPEIVTSAGGVLI